MVLILIPLIERKFIGRNLLWKLMRIYGSVLTLFENSHAECRIIRRDVKADLPREQKVSMESFLADQSAR